MPINLTEKAKSLCVRIDKMYGRPGIRDSQKPSRLREIRRIYYDSLDSVLEDDVSEKYKSLTPDMLILLFSKADPSAKKIYTEWIVLLYCFKDILLEDLAFVSSLLKKFHNILSNPKLSHIKEKLEPEDKDIFKYDSKGKLWQTLAACEEMTDESKSLEDLITQVNRDNVEDTASRPDIITHYKGPRGWIRTPTTIEASQYIGVGTTWCTAYTDPTTPNRFEEYNASSPLYVIYNRSTRVRYQLHAVGKSSLTAGGIKNQIDEDVNSTEFTKANLFWIFDILPKVGFDIETFLKLRPDLKTLYMIHTFNEAALLEEISNFNPKVILYYNKNILDILSDYCEVVFEDTEVPQKYKELIQKCIISKIEAGQITVDSIPQLMLKYIDGLTIPSGQVKNIRTIQLIKDLQYLLCAFPLDEKEILRIFRRMNVAEVSHIGDIVYTKRPDIIEEVFEPSYNRSPQYFIDLSTLVKSKSFGLYEMVERKVKVSIEQTIHDICRMPKFEHNLALLGLKSVVNKSKTSKEDLIAFVQKTYEEKLVQRQNLVNR